LEKEWQDVAIRFRWAWLSPNHADLLRAARRIAAIADFRLIVFYDYANRNNPLA
jgi:hypothetical protein